MWNSHNVHKMFINIYRNLKTRNWFRYKTFIHLFEFKGFSTWGERDTIFLCWLLLHRQLSTQPMCGARSAQIRLASPSSESRLPRSEAETQLFAFSQIPKILNPCFWCTMSFTPTGLNFLSGIFILTSLNDISSPCACEHLLSCLHLTNPCTEPKDSHPN